jgi:hypothetical protein
MKMAGLITAAAIALLAAPASAAVGARDNLGFESGDFSGWTTTGSDWYLWNGRLYSFPPIDPYSGDYFAFVEVALDADIYATISRSIWLRAGETLHGAWQFSNQDVALYNDEGYFSINGATLFTSSGSVVGDYGKTGWLPFDFKAPVTGDYLIEAGVRNRYDIFGPSSVLLDIAGITSVPETATWAMLIAGFGMIGFGARRKRQAAA